MMLEIALGERDSVDTWADRIRASWERTARGIIATGELLIEAKEDLPHGDWLPLLAQIGFPERKAQRLMEISRDSRLLNPSILTLLPDRWTKLHDLHKLEDDELDEALLNPHLIKAKRRAERERELGAKQCALPQKKYGVIVADPEWNFQPWSDETGMDRAAGNHYPTSPVEQIIARDVVSIAADDCVLFLWATAPCLEYALAVLNGWGFSYKSHCVWDKLVAGTGYWFRNRHELLLIGTKGNIPAPAMGEQEHSIISAQKGKHSAKPDKFLRLIEIHFPTLPKIELNRRGPARPGWDAWGNEIEATAGA